MSGYNLRERVRADLVRHAGKIPSDILASVQDVFTLNFSKLATDLRDAIDDTQVLGQEIAHELSGEEAADFEARWKAHLRRHQPQRSGVRKGPARRGSSGVWSAADAL